MILLSRIAASAASRPRNAAAASSDAPRRTRGSTRRGRSSGAPVDGARAAADAVIDHTDALAHNLIFELNKLHAGGQGLEGFSSVTGTNAGAFRFGLQNGPNIADYDPSLERAVPGSC